MNMWKRLGLLSLVLVVMLTIGLVGCGNKTEDTGQPEQSPGVVAGDDQNKEAKQEEEAQGEAGFPVTITDGAEREITIEQEPESIVSVLPSNTEIAYALGLGDKIVGVSTFCNYPAEALEVQKVGDMDLDEEAIISLMPDLILFSPYQYGAYTESVQRFEELGMQVIVVQDSADFEDVYSTIRLIGQATGAEAEADQIIADMEQRLAGVKEKAAAITESKRVWVEVSPAPDIFTTGKNTFMDEMLQSINAINTAGDQEGWVSLTEEEMIQLNPDVIITTYGSYVENPEEEVLNRAGWGEVPAVKEKQVFDVNEDLVSRPGPRLIDGVEELAAFIYPEIFK